MRSIHRRHLPQRCRIATAVYSVFTDSCCTAIRCCVDTFSVIVLRTKHILQQDVDLYIIYICDVVCFVLRSIWRWATLCCVRRYRGWRAVYFVLDPGVLLSFCFFGGVRDESILFRFTKCCIAYTYLSTAVMMLVSFFTALTNNGRAVFYCCFRAFIFLLTRPVLARTCVRVFHVRCALACVARLSNVQYFVLRTKFKCDI